MNLIFLILFPLYGIMAEMPSHFECPKKIEKNGMKVSWQFKAEKIHFEVFAPDHGWLAVGFNNKDALIGTNLIMGRSELGEIQISDRFIIGLGDHQSVKQLGGTSLVQNLEVTEDQSGTSMKFSLPIQKSDAWHFDLRPGTSIYLLLAYSEKDDFAHHSRMRTNLKINL